MICRSGGSKSRLAKAAGAEPAGRQRRLWSPCGVLHVRCNARPWSECRLKTKALPPLWQCCSEEGWCAHHRMALTPQQSIVGWGKDASSAWSQYLPWDHSFLRWEMKNCTPLWHEAHFQVKMYKTHHVRTPFGSWDVEKVHAVVARSTFRSQNVQKTPCSDPFWKLRCRKSARGCGTKHISKSKCTKHTMFEPFWKLRCRKSARRCGAKHISKSKMYKTPGVQTTFGRLDVVSRGRRKGLCTLSKVSKTKTWGFCSIFNYNHHCTTRRSNTLHYNYNYTFTTFHYTTLHTLHYTTLHLITLNYTPLHSTTLHSITLRYITLQYTTFHYTPLHCTQLHYTALHYTTLHSTTLNYTTLTTTTTTTTTGLHLHYATLHYTNYTALHYSTPHCITLHYATLVTPQQMQLQLHYTDYTTPQLQLHYTTTTTTAALHRTTSGSCGWGDRPAATIAATPKNTAPTTFRSISGFALPSVIHNNQSLL